MRSFVAPHADRTRVAVTTYPNVSIVIPTYNRRERLRECLGALERQTQPASDFEVIVVVDGSIDGTREMLESFEPPFALRIIALENSGYGAARNRGVEAASGRYVLFLDDDVVASPELVAEHLRSLGEHEGAMIIGPYPQRLPPGAGRFARAWADLREEYYVGLQGRKLGFRACHTGNVSLPREVFLAVGGFAEDLPRAVDLELGYRLEQAGVEFVYEPRALGYEDQRESSKDMIADAELRGTNALELWRRHPAIIASTRLGGYGDLGRAWIGLRLVLMTLRVPPRLLDVFGYMLPRWAWARKWYWFLYTYCYWRGIRRAVDRETWKRLVRGTPILMYHAIGGPGEPASRYVVPRRRFERHMRWLSRRGYRVIALDEFVGCLRDHTLPPAKSVVITFDDGYQDVRDHATPVLESLGLPATVFLVTASGSRATWATAASYSSGRPLITPSDARDWSNSLVSFGAHTRTHRDLTSLSGADVEEEVSGSRRDLEAALGASVGTFSYPYGRWTPEIRDVVREAGFLAACSVDAGRNRLAADPFALRRLEIRGTDSLPRFALTLWLGDTRSLLHRFVRLTMIRLRSRLKLLVTRVCFSPYFPRRLRDRYLDWHIARAATNVLSHRDPPQTFNDKVRYKMLHDRRPLLTTFADKFAVREYVERRVGGHVLTQLHLVTQDPRDLRPDVLPEEFALKATHGCRGSVLVAEHFGHAELPKPPAGWISLAVSPEALDWDRLRGLCREWLVLRYRPKVEWAYRNVPPRILVEELLIEGGAVPTDYKFFVFHGRVRLVQVDLDRATSHKRIFYTRDWEAVPVQASHPRGPEIARPGSLAEMVSIAERLSEETDFLRVDLYSLGERVVVGELTNYPRAGTTRYKPASFDWELGAWWSPPNDYRSLVRGDGT